MKDKTLLEMKNKVEALGRIMQNLLDETSNLRELAIGTFETMKKMPGYEEAIDQLKKELVEKPKEKKLEI
tara:strand:+ start:396 stop:605 length:210 start_codon:yes stop_codon:yes gene_type:complete